MLYTENKIVEETLTIFAAREGLCASEVDAYFYVNDVPFENAETVIKSLTDDDFDDLLGKVVEKVLEARYAEKEADGECFSWVSVETVQAYMAAKEYDIEFNDVLKGVIYEIADEAEDCFQYQTERFNGKAEYAEYYFSEYLTDSEEIVDVYGLYAEDILYLVNNGGSERDWERVYMNHLDDEVFIFNGFVFNDC